MATFIFGARNNIHIIDLAQTVPLLHQALVKVSDIVAGGGRVLFVGTKRQASEGIAEAAKRSAQYYINHRWLGGTLTNWKTISQSIRRLRQLDEMLAGDAKGRTKKEVLQLTRERDKLNQSLGGIKEMGGLPDLLFVIDTNKEQIAIAEAKKLGIPIVAVVDTNCDPDGIDFPIPGNDDAGRAITLYCDLVARAAIDGIERGQASAGVDIGASENAARRGAAGAAQGRVQGHRGAARRSRRPQAPARRQRRSSSSASTTPASTTSGRSPISTRTTLGAARQAAAAQGPASRRTTGSARPRSSSTASRCLMCGPRGCAPADSRQRRTQLWPTRLRPHSFRPPIASPMGTSPERNT